MRFRAPLLLLLLFISHQTHAQEDIRVGVGALSCAEVAKVMTSKSEESKMLLVSWMQGYLAGMNTVQSALAPDRGIKSIPDSDSLQAHILLFCKQNSNVKLIHAATAFFTQLPAAKK